jgi:hypothetical protein
MLDQVERLISVERFQSLTDPSKFLSLLSFQDEAAIAWWRTLGSKSNCGEAGTASDGLLITNGSDRPFAVCHDAALRASEATVHAPRSISTVGRSAAEFANSRSAAWILIQPKLGMTLD